MEGDANLSFKRNSTRIGWFDLVRGRRLLFLVLALFAGVLVSVTAFAISSRIERIRADERAAETLDRAVSRLPILIEERLSGLDGIARFFENSQDVTKTEFDNFAEPMIRSCRDIVGIAWAPRVPHDSLEAFERKASKALGISNYRVFGSEGQGVPVSSMEFRDFYPYLYAIPMGTGRCLLGFDSWTDVKRRMALELARDRGFAAATGVTPLLSDVTKDVGCGVFICMPVYDRSVQMHTVEQRRSALRGFVAMVIRPESLVKSLDVDGKFKGFDVEMIDRPPALQGKRGGIVASSVDGRRVMDFPFSLAGHEFCLRFVPVADGFAFQGAKAPWIYLLCGLLSTFAIVGFYASRELRLLRLNRALRRRFGSDDLKTASAIRVKIVMAVALSMSIMLVWLLFWTRRELRNSSRAATVHAVEHASNMWGNMVEQDVSSLRNALSFALADETLCKAWSKKDRNLAGRRIVEFAEHVNLGQPGDSIVLLGPDRRCFVSSSMDDSYAELFDSGMLQECAKSERMIQGLELRSDGSLKLRVCSPFPAEGGGLIVLSKDASLYPEFMRRAIGCGFFVTLNKKVVDERRWRQASRQLFQSLSSWDDYADFVVAGQGALNPELVAASLRALLNVSWKGVVFFDFGSASWSSVADSFKDYSGKPLGRLVVLRNTTAEEMAGKESLALSFAGAGLLAGLLVIGIYFFASSVERRLLRSIMDRDSEASALHALQDRLASTLRSIGDAVISTDLEGRVTSMNPMAETLTGWSFQESEGRPIDVVFNLIDSSTGKKAEIPVERVFREGRIVGLANHSAIISRQGVERQIADSAAPIRNSKGVIIGSVLVFRDVTEEYAMRDALKRSEMRFRLLAELAKDVIYRMSVPSGVLEYTSPAITELTGFTQEEAAAPGFLRKVVFKADLDVFETAVREAFAGHPQPYTEFRVVRKDGRTVWLSTRTNCIKDPTGRIIALQGSATDISSRKAVEEALAKSESLYRGLVDNIDMGILLYDTGHRVVMVNKYVAAKMGRDVSFFIGRTCYEIFHSSDVVCPHCPCEKARLSGMPESSEFDYEEPDGEWRRFHARAIPLKEKDGSISHFIEVIEDITAQSKSEERKSHLEQQLLQSQKMDSLGRLAGGIAHDFNNMLTPVIGYSDMLLKKGGSLDDPKARRKLEQILAAGNKARDLTRQLLAMGRKQALQMRYLDINRLVREFERMLLRTIREDISITLDLAELLGSVYADPSQLDQILLNLVVNAQDAMPGGGRLTIRTFERGVDEAFAFAHDGAKPGVYVCLQVADTGTGIDQEILDKIFEPFFTTKPKGKGTGLGLSTVYGIAKQHGGFIDVASSLGQGSSFTVFLPKAGPPLEDGADNDETPASRAAEQPSLHPCFGRILVAEDDLNVLNMVSDALRAKGYEVFSAPDGRKALELANQLDALDLLVSDIVMPGLNGKDLCEKLRQAGKLKKALFMSGYTNNLMSDGVRLGGQTSFIQKPFTVDELERKIMELMDGRA